jgi:glutamine synthetase
MTSLDGLRWVRLSFVDVFGAAHSVQLPASRFDDAVAHGAAFDGSALEGRARLLESDMLLKPDPASLQRVSEEVGRAACNVLTRDGRPWPGDPRTALTALLDELGDLAESYRVAPELELYLLDEDGSPIDGGGYFDDVEGVGMAVVREAAERIGTQGVEVVSCHHEAGPGQFEVDLSPLTAMAAADAIVAAKQTLRDVARAVGLRATFMPRPLAGEPGSGLHLHQQLEGRLVDESGKLDDEGRAFCAGQLASARGLSALAAPTVNSYKRLHAGPEAPGAAVWAHANRAALLRVRGALGGSAAAAIEYRGSDPSANPYLLIGGLLVTAAHGLEADLELPPPVEEAVGSFDPADGDSVRFDPLPRDLDEALDALLSDDVLVDAFDTQLLSRLVDGRRAEAESYRAQVTAWERARYLDEV